MITKDYIKKRYGSYLNSIANLQFYQIFSIFGNLIFTVLLVRMIDFENSGRFVLFL